MRDNNPSIDFLFNQICPFTLEVLNKKARHYREVVALSIKELVV